MTTTRATSVKEYLDRLPPDRRAVVSKVRNLVRKHLPTGYRETINWGIITYEIPLKRYPDTYNGQPLGYVGIAAQKNFYAVYLMAAYTGSKQLEILRAGFRKAGKKLDMGKSCIRFRQLEDLPLETIGKVVASMSPAQYIRQYEVARK